MTAVLKRAEIVAATAIIDMNGSTDYVEAYVYSNGTVAQGTAQFTYFQGSMLAPLASGVVAGTGSAGYVPVWTGGNAVTYDSTSGGQFAWDLTNHRLGIGTTSPGFKLDVNGGINIAAGQNYNQQGVSVLRTSDNANTVVNPPSASGGVYLAWDRGSGGVFMGNLPNNSAGYALCYNNSNGQLMWGAACNWSDERLKTNIKPLAPVRGLAAIERLHPVTFNWPMPIERRAMGCR